MRFLYFGDVFGESFIILSSDCCDRLFEHYNTFAAENSKKKAGVWPLQMMLLVLCPVSNCEHLGFQILLLGLNQDRHLSFRLLTLNRGKPDQNQMDVHSRLTLSCYVVLQFRPPLPRPSSPLCRAWVFIVINLNSRLAFTVPSTLLQFPFCPALHFPFACCLLLDGLVREFLH